MKTHSNSFVWLSAGFQVVGWDPEELNGYIRKYNNEKIYRYTPFFDWLSYETGEHYTGFCPIWNNKNPLISKLIKIKSA